MDRTKMGGIMLYREDEEYLNMLTDEQCGILLRNIFKYSSDEELIEMDVPTKLVFTAFRQKLDRNREHYEKVCEAHRAAGQKGGRPRKTNGSDGNQNNQKVIEENQKKQMPITITKTITKTKKDISTGNPALDKALQDFIEHRKKMKAPMSDRAVELLLSRLTTLFGENTEAKIEALNRAIMNGWKSVYEDKQTKKGGATKFSNFPQRGYDFEALEAQLLKEGS